MDTPPRRFLTVNEAKAELRVGHTRIYKMMNDGLIEGVKMGRKRLIPIDSIEHYINSIRKAAA